ncbi:hypothetical protein QCA50_017591 [Cerrena zonata]|uniref:Ribosomal protein bL31m N-terminal domain-containing protein n=1 Tax=Cerrena zonata TaxID=2478898 RepID=A0AAW0FMG1_9APHY
MKKIEMGKSRPTIFHQFETLVELSDGFSAFETKEEKPDAKAEAASPTNKYENDDFIELMGHDVKEAPKGQLEQKNRGGKKK